MSRAVVGGDFPGALSGIAPCDLADTFACHIPQGSMAVF